MGDSESRRPKFILIIWLGSKVGVMKRAPVGKSPAQSRPIVCALRVDFDRLLAMTGMQKADVQRVIGAIHLELEIDSVVRFFFFFFSTFLTAHFCSRV